MPPYAMNSYDLTRILREELESKYVRENIHKWIDLIFGVDQKSSEKHTIFFAAAYPDYHKNNSIERIFDDEATTEYEKREDIKKMIQNMNEMCVIPPKLFSSSLDQIIQKSRKKIESNARHAISSASRQTEDQKGVE